MESGAIDMLSGELLECALAELRLALEYRANRVVRTANNHYSPHALGSLLLLVTAFDVWLTELISKFGYFNTDFKKLGCESALQKFYGLPKQLTGTTIPPHRELELLVELRHEIAHSLPRVIKDKGNVPAWFAELNRRRLFCTGPDPEADFYSIASKFASYRLAYWSWETVEGAIGDLFEALSPMGERLSGARGVANNFTLYRAVYSPAQLVLFDQAHKLSLTSKG